MAGIVGYGAYIPRNRIRTGEIARQWGQDPETMRNGLKLEEKSVPGLDEDTITISVTAGRAGLCRTMTLSCLLRHNCAQIVAFTGHTGVQAVRF